MKEKGRGENQIIIGDNLTTVSPDMPLYMEKDAPLHMEDDIVAHLWRRQEANFGYLIALRVSLE